MTSQKECVFTLEEKLTVSIHRNNDTQNKEKNLEKKWEAKKQRTR